MPLLEEVLETRLTRLAQALVDPTRGRIIVPAQQNATGFWFGGGNMVESPDGSLWLVGRYRNFGDSRTGLGAGERGLELALFRSTDRGQTFEKQLSFDKSDLDVGPRSVLSIEGSALHWTESGVELFVSTEKSGVAYPPGFESFLKPGAGVWTIERLAAESIQGLASARVATVLECADPRYLHVKDPVTHDLSNGDLLLMFCTHPYGWSSSNTAFCVRPRGVDSFSPPAWDRFPRGVTWDVAMTRGTCVVDVPAVGAFAERRVSLLFYDGGESLRNLDEHAQAVKRPRGYSCEELGGVAYFVDDDWTTIERLSRFHPFFLSPSGTGCNRYVDILRASDGYYATWQQSQPDLSQPLVMNYLSHQTVADLLASA